MRLVISTAPPNKAGSLARALVEERLAACVNIVPKASSVYIWKGQLEEETESILFIKTTDGRVKDLTERLTTLHPYDVPEIISLTIRDDEGNRDYLSWLRSAVGG